MTMIGKIILFAVFFYAGALATTGTSFGRGTGPTIINNVQCIGSETQLMDCRRIELSERTCSHTSFAGVQCHERTGLLSVLFHPPTTKC